MTTLIRRMPAWAEFCLVILVCFWWGIYGSILSIAHRSWSTPTRTEPTFAGIGVALGVKEKKVIIMQVLPGTPAFKAGLSRGLEIQKIDGTSVEGKPLKEYVDMLRGSAGSKVTLELVEAGDNRTNTVELTRERLQPASPRIYMTDRVVVRLLILELAGLAVTFWIARARDWPLGTWGFRPSWKSIGAGVVLCVATLIVLVPVILIAKSMLPPGTIHHYLVGALSWPFLFLLVLINPIFEEAMEVGYFFQALQRRGMWAVVFASACFRAFLHAYQGINAIVVVFPLGLLFGFVYWKWRRLWPLFVAHMMFDFYALYPGFHAS